MANKAPPKLIGSAEEAYPLNGRGFEKNGRGFESEEKDNASCFLSPFLCGASSPRLVAYVHIGIMTAATVIALLVFIVLAIANSGEILFYVGLAGAVFAFIPLPFLLSALLGMMKHRANTCLPLVVFLCFMGVSFTGLFVFVMVVLYGADTNMHVLVVLIYALSLVYLSHVIRVLLRVRLDTLQARERINYTRNVTKPSYFNTVL